MKNPIPQLELPKKYTDLFQKELIVFTVATLLFVAIWAASLITMCISNF